MLLGATSKLIVIPYPFLGLLAYFSIKKVDRF